jgi:hypothetical protein
MKKLLIITSVLITAFSVNKASAQTTGSTTLSVTLTKTQSITVNQTNVGLNFLTSADYLNGVNAAQANHLTFASTSGFSISAKAGTDLTGGTGGDIPISTVNITPTTGTIGTSPGGTATAQPLSKTTAAIIYTSGTASTGGTAQASLNIDYKASGTDYLNRTGTFSSVITYTIAPL